MDPYSSGVDDYIPRKRSPWVLVGAFGTASILLGGLIAFRRGNQNLSQHMMRARVVAQGATVAIMAGTAGAASLGSAAEEPQPDTLSPASPMKRKAKKAEELQ